MKGWIAGSSTFIFLAVFLSACATGDMAESVSANGDSLATASDTKFVFKTRTSTINPPTPTQLPTVIPVRTPTEGPPPDLELVNIQLAGTHIDTFIGEIRNNTDTTMVFPLDPGINREKGRPFIRFILEAWGWDWTWPKGYYYYTEFSRGKGSSDMPNTNCFLYPGETGVIINRIKSGSDNYDFENRISKNEELLEPPEVIGKRLVGYQDLKTYTLWPDLYPDYHPQAEDLVYEVMSDSINFSFDLQKSFFKGYAFRYAAWLLLYDKTGGLVNVLYNTKLEKIMVENNDMYHISGYSKYNYSPSPEYFWNTNMNVDSVGWDGLEIDHIRVFVEAQHEFLCGMYTNYDIYRNKEKGIT